MRVRLWVVVVTAVFAGHLLSAQAPRPKPKPEPAPAAPRPRPDVREKVESATLLITADAAAVVYVDAAEIGSFVANDVRSVTVGLGQHLVRAVAGDIRWEQVVNADKPVQIVVRTGIRAIAEERAAAAAKRSEDRPPPVRPAEPAVPADVAPPTVDQRALLGYDSSANNLQEGSPGKDVVYVPTPATAAYAMLTLAGVGPKDTVYDLGSGDGRIVIMAAKHFGARGVGIEYNPQLTAIANRNAQAAGVADRVSFRTEDLFTTDLSAASVITMFLLPDINARLRPKLMRLAPGTRIVSNTFTMDGWVADRQVTQTNGCTSWCTALLWVVPARGR